MPNENLIVENIQATPETPRVYAGFFARFTAFILDKIIVGVPLFFVRIIFFMMRFGNPSHFLTQKIFFSFTVSDIILYCLASAYFIGMTYYTGRTLGKRLMRLQVVSAFDRKPSFFEIFFRETFGRFLSTFILCIGYLMIGAGTEKQALHDYLADTRVVYEWSADR